MYVVIDIILKHAPALHKEEVLVCISLTHSASWMVGKTEGQGQDLGGPPGFRGDRGEDHGVLVQSEEDRGERGLVSRLGLRAGLPCHKASS